MSNLTPDPASPSTAPDDTVLDDSAPQEPVLDDTVPDEPTPTRVRRRPWRLVILLTLLAVGVGALVYERHRTSASERFRRGLAALDHGDAEGIRRELPGWPLSPRFEPHRHFLAGALFLQEGQPGLALEELRYAADVPELHVRTLTLAGQALYQLGQQAEALKPLSRAVDVDDQAVDAHRWLASCYYDLGAIHQALSHLTIVAELAPQDPRPHRLMGLMHKDFEHYDEAIKSYRESLRRSEKQLDTGEILLELAECQVKQRDYEGALQTLQRCREDPVSWVLAAECQHGLTRPEEAQRLLDKALAQAPDGLPPLLLAATLQLEAGRGPEAAVLLERAVAKHPKDYTAHFKLAQAYRRIGKEAEAAQQMSLSDDLKKLRETFTKLHEQAADRPQDADLRFQLGRTALALDRADLADVWFRMALAINPRHAEAAAALDALNAGASSPPGSRP